MTHRSRQWTLPLLMVAALSSGAFGQEEPSERPDARVEGYQLSTGEQATVGRIMLEKGRGQAGSWFIFAGLGLLGIGVMFKSGKRTHLD
ncbi:MAG: hypothetical protein H7144_14220 [Burkholderiales bacterium]|nr:hypothetical protein [Phycisphaerae bacterium]